MQSTHDILADLWAQAGGKPASLEAVKLTGAEPTLPSSFRVAAAAQASIAATGLAAAEIARLRGGPAQSVSVDMLHAAIECRSERYLSVADTPPPAAWDAIAGVYKTGDGRFVEIQGTAETEPFDREMMDRMIETASIGVDYLIAIQRDLIVQTLNGKEFRAMADPASRTKINWKEDAS